MPEAMFVVLMALWVIFSGYLEPFFFLSGVISVLSSMLVLHILSSGELENINLSYTYNKFLHLYPRLFLYLFWILGQTFLSSWYVAKRVWRISKMGSPVFSLVDTKQLSPFGAFMLAHSVTLTPGTVGMSVDPDYKMLVFAMDSELLPGVSDIDSRVALLENNP